MTPVLQAPAQGGTSRGISYYEKAASFCPRKANLDDEERQAAEAEGLIYTPRGGNSDIGTCFHLLAEAFYKGEIQNAAVQVSDANWEEPFLKAREMFEAFLHQFPEPDFWGEVISAEGDIVCRNPQEVFGVEHFTGQIDLATRLSGPYIERIAARTADEKLDELEPGVLLVDWKCTGRSRPKLAYTLRQQFQAYCLLWEAETGETPQGVVAVEPFISMAKKPDYKVRTYFVPYPDEQEVAGLKAYLTYAEKLAKENQCLGRGQGCMSYGRACRHLETGACERV